MSSKGKGVVKGELDKKARAKEIQDKIIYYTSMLQNENQSYLIGKELKTVSKNDLGKP